MTRILSTLALFVVTVALARAVLERRAPGRLPLVDLVAASFPPVARRWAWGSVLAGACLALLPLVVLAALGCVRWASAPAPWMPAMLPRIAATVVIVLVWAALEELLFRGALLPQLGRYVGATPALVGSAVLFGLAHLGRTDGGAASVLAAAAWSADGLVFGVLCLSTRGLRAPALAHAAKNLVVWLLTSHGTLQLAPGLLAARTTGPVAWVGGAHAPGAADAITSLLVAVVLTLVAGRRLTAGLLWVQSRPER